MKLTIERETLLKPLQLIAGIVEKKQTLAVLANALFVVKDQTLTITATDLEVELIARIALSAPATPGKITIPARKLIDICRNLPDAEAITITINNNKVNVSAARSRFSLATLPADEFPNVEISQNTAEFLIPECDFRFLLDRTHFCMAQQDVRYYLNGLLLEINNGYLNSVATNGHRLAWTSLAQQAANDELLRVIIPRKGVLELLKLLGQSDDKVTVSLGQNHICVESADYKLISKLIDGQFPDYDRVIPKNGDKVITLNRDSLKQMLSRVAILANEKYRGVRVQLRENLLILSANNPEQEEAEEECKLEYIGEELDIGFNVSYLLDVLSSVPTGDVKLTFSDPTSSVLLESAVEEDHSCKYVVMPMRL